MEDEKQKKIRRPMRRIESKKALRVTYKKRKDCIKKKTMELATLCGINACTLCFGPDGEAETWPENPSDVKALIKMYKESDKNGGRVRKVSKSSSSDYSLDAEKVKKVESKKEESSINKRLSGWDDGWLDGLSEESLMNFSGQLESKLEVLKARIEFLKMVSQQNRAVAVVGKETEEASWFDDTTAIDNLEMDSILLEYFCQPPPQETTQMNFEMDNLSMLLEPYYQPPQQTTQLNLQMDDLSVLPDPCYQPPQQTTQLNLQMDDLSVLPDPCYQPPQQTTDLNFEMDDLSALLEPYYQPLQTTQEWFP